MKTVYFIGIKGTGMCALAELLQKHGVKSLGSVKVRGSDVATRFYTDAILKELNIPYFEGFDAAHISADVAADVPELVIYSAAYNETNVELAEAMRRGIRTLKYTDALGEYSADFDSTGIAGVHGKTTTTALAGTVVHAAGLPAQVLAGSAVSSFGGHCTVSYGNKFFIAETCEYRKHFLAFHPQRIILTSVESDHQDFFPTYESIRDAFVEYCLLLPNDGELIFCADDKGAAEVANIVRQRRATLTFTPYGFNAEGDFKIIYYKVENERQIFKLRGWEQEFRLRVSGKHNVLNASAALALLVSLDGAATSSVATALENFRGSKRRSEILGEVKGVLFMDDYGHHPTAIKTTLAGLKQFYPRRRLVVSFMSHTYTRTAALLEEFATAFNDADILLLHKIYASAREKYTGGVTGKTLFERTKQERKKVYYFEEYMEALDFLKETLKNGDIFLTMGAGDNWQLGAKLLEEFKK